MVRNYKRKIPFRPELSEDDLREAFHDVLSKSSSMRKASQNIPISKSTLHRYLKKGGNFGNFSEVKSTHHCQVFSNQLENEFAQYLIEAQVLNHGFIPEEVKHLAFSFANANHIKIPPAWEEFASAGSDWFSRFMKRNKELSIRKPETTNQARAAAVNRVVIDKF